MRLTKPDCSPERSEGRLLWYEHLRCLKDFFAALLNLRGVLNTDVGPR